MQMQIQDLLLQLPSFVNLIKIEIKIKIIFVKGHVTKTTTASQLVRVTVNLHFRSWRIWQTEILVQMPIRYEKVESFFLQRKLNW
jgi:hypothetical protein